jgi:hypothetical protein
MWVERIGGNIDKRETDEVYQLERKKRNGNGSLKIMEAESITAKRRLCKLQPEKLST